MMHELYDYETANAIFAGEGEAAALAAVRETVREGGRAMAATLVLFAVTDDGERVPVAASDELIARAEAAVAVGSD